MKQDVVRQACYLVGSHYRTLTSEQLGAAITAPVALRPYAEPLTGFFSDVVTAGGAAAELRPIWAYDRWIERLAEALSDGALVSVQALMATCPVWDALGPHTQAAVSQVLQSRSIRLVDTVAAALDVDAPESVTAEDVDGALGRD
jgi:hypothetical protein